MRALLVAQQDRAQRRLTANEFDPSGQNEVSVRRREQNKIGVVPDGRNCHTCTSSFDEDIIAALVATVVTEEPQWSCAVTGRWEFNRMGGRRVRGLVPRRRRGWSSWRFFGSGGVGANW